MPEDPFVARRAGQRSAGDPGVPPRVGGGEACRSPRRHHHRRARAAAAAARAQPPAAARAPGGRRRRAPRPAARRARRTAAGGRRILAVLALALIGGALWLINATFQPFHDDPSGAVRVTVPSGSDAGRIGKILESAGVIDSARLFEANATRHDAARQAAPRQLPAAARDEQRRRHRGADAGPAGEGRQDLQVHAPRGPLAAGERPARRQGAFDGRLRQGDRPTRARCAAGAQLGAPRSARSLEGFLFPATYQMISGASARDLVERQLDAFRENFAKVDLKTARERNLTRYDVLIIASMVEREAQLAKERPLIAAVMLQPPQGGHPARHRRHHPLPDQQLVAAAARLRARARHAVQHAHAPRPAADADRQPGPRVDQGGRQPGEGQVPVLRAQARASPASTHSRSTNAQFERDVARYQASRGGP